MKHLKTTQLPYYGYVSMKLKVNIPIKFAFTIASTELHLQYLSARLEISHSY